MGVVYVVDYLVFAEGAAGCVFGRGFSFGLYKEGYQGLFF